MRIYKNDYKQNLRVTNQHNLYPLYTERILFYNYPNPHIYEYAYIRSQKILPTSKPRRHTNHIYNNTIY